MSNENEGPCQYELDRLARIAENKKRMEAMGIFKIANDLAKKCAPKKKPQQPRAKKVYIDAGPIRRSNRQQNKTPVNYADDIRLERIERQPRTNTRQQRRMPMSSKVPNFPIQSAAAIRLATEAAKAKVDELGNRGFYKEMQPSNVSSGYWLQLPVEMGTTWRFPPGTNNIELECHDDCRNADGWIYEKYPGEDRKRWYTVWLVRGGNSCGLSGGWRGFAIDQQLTWNDTVVFEVPEDTPEGQLPTYIHIHTYRAENYETDETLPLVVPAKEVYASLLAQLPTEDDEEDGKEEHEGTPAESADGQAAGKDKAAALKAKKKRIAEVAGSLKGATREAKRQKKAAAAEKGAAAEEQADEDMTEAGDDAELAPATPDAEEANAGAVAAAVEADAAGAVDAGPLGAAAEKPKRKRRAEGTASGQPLQQDVTAKGKENAKKAPRRNAAQNEKETVQDGSKSGKATAAKKKAPTAERPPALQAADEEEGEEEEEEEEVFYVKQVLKARKLSTSEPEFRIRWWNYAPEHDTWEPLSSLDADPLDYDWADAAAKEKARTHAAKWKAAE